MEDTKKIKRAWCDALWNARETLNPASELSETYGELSVDQAYDVQEMVLEKKITAGERIIGWKIGATTQAVLDQLKGTIDEPILGCMTTSSLHSATAEISASDFYNLRFEPEIAFLMEKPIMGPGANFVDVVTAAYGVTACIELVDSRITSRSFRIAETIADNSSHGGIVLGPMIKPISGLDLRLEGVMVRKNGLLLGSACGCEVLENPFNAVIWLANRLARMGRGIETGDIITTGSLTKVHHLNPGDVVDVSYTHLGNIQIRIVA